MGRHGQATRPEPLLPNPFAYLASEPLVFMRPL